MTDELEKLRRELAQARETIRLQQKEISDLNDRLQDVQSKLEILQRQRPKLSPQNLIDSFGRALTRMQEGLEVSPGRVKYAINNFDIQLKTAVTLDEDGEINFQLPKVDDILPLENLSRMNLSIMTVPKPETPLTETVEVPQVVGLSQEKAAEVLQAAGFTTGEITDQLSSTPAETVLAQDPEGYMRAPAGMAIDLVVSKVRETKVPNVLGLTQETAVEVLAAERLQLGEIKAEISASPPGTVIQQSLSVGTVVAVGTPVDLVVAKAEMIVVPEVVGSSLAAARRILAKELLKVGQVTAKLSARPQGEVLSQNPAAGREALAGSAVDLTVSQPRRVEVPDLKGLKQVAAEARLKEAGLQIGRVVRRRSRQAAGTVIGQKPNPGDQVEVGSAVNLTIALGSPGARSPRR